eukprot:17756-Heterococcus_DN1.PRE.1
MASLCVLVPGAGLSCEDNQLSSNDRFLRRCYHWIQTNWLCSAGSTAAARCLQVPVRIIEVCCLLAFVGLALYDTSECHYTACMQETMCAVSDSFRDALLQAGGQNSFMRTKWYLFSIGAFFSYGRLLCWEAVSSGELSVGAVRSSAYSIIHMLSKYTGVIQYESWSVL